MKRTNFGQWVALVFSFYILMGLTPLVQGESAKGEEVMAVSIGKTVSIEYTLKLEDQTVVESTVGKEPMVYKHGSDLIMIGLQKSVEGMKPGESKQFTVKPEERFGKINENALLEVNKNKVPPEDLKIGVPIQGKNDKGQPP